MFGPFNDQNCSGLMKAEYKYDRAFVQGTLSLSLERDPKAEADFEAGRIPWIMFKDKQTKKFTMLLFQKDGLLESLNGYWNKDALELRSESENTKSYIMFKFKDDNNMIFMWEVRNARSGQLIFLARGRGHRGE